VICFALGALVVAIILLARAAGGWPKSGYQGYLDYMPDAVEPCPSSYKCGATTRRQVKMENNLFSDLRESSKYALPESVTTDQYSVIATESEPPSCMMRRAALAHEKPKEEGQYTPYEEIEEGYLKRKQKQDIV
jgi:hypothetical protein